MRTRSLPTNTRSLTSETYLQRCAQVPHPAGTLYAMVVAVQWLLQDLIGEINSHRLDRLTSPCVFIDPELTELVSTCDQECMRSTSMGVGVVPKQSSVVESTADELALMTHAAFSEDAPRSLNDKCFYMLSKYLFWRR